jgi:hypothetical protein
MNSPNKPAMKSPGVPGNVTQVLRETTEKTAAQAKEAFEDVSAATTAAGNLVRDTYSTAAKSAQEYNAKVIEFAQTNTQTNLEFVQKLSNVNPLQSFSNCRPIIRGSSSKHWPSKPENFFRWRRKPC